MIQAVVINSIMINHPTNGDIGLKKCLSMRFSE